MSEFLNQISTNAQIVPVMIFSLLGVIVLVSIVGAFATTIRRDAAMTRLKQDMLDRGMTAEEIKTVLESGQK